MSVIGRAFSALGKLGIIVAIAIAFFVGLLGTIYYSLRSREVNVPNIVGKDVLEGEKALDQDGLNMRRRATRYSPNARPNTILDQSPHAGEIIKIGQTVAVVVSRASAKEGEDGVPSSSEENFAEEKNANAEAAAEKTRNENSNKDKANKNTRNKNTNNSNNDNSNRTINSKNTNNRNANDRNANNGAVNANRGSTDSNRNTNSNNRNANSGRDNANTDSIRRPPVTATPGSGQNRNRRVP